MDLDGGVDECARRLLWQIMADAQHRAMLVLSLGFPACFGRLELHWWSTGDRRRPMVGERGPVRLRG
jgi:hypothetical protein